MHTRVRRPLIFWCHDILSLNLVYVMHTFVLFETADKFFT